ncbi:MAG: hypothetical protein FWD35_01400 [Oscillospiraceae bacterium]|nr:hypothetical protein [Oscillospiraceae bacterium]
MLQSHVGYFSRNGSFLSDGKVIKFTPEKKAVVSVLDEPAVELKIISPKTAQERWEAMKSIRGIWKDHIQLEDEKLLISERLWKKYL